MKRLVVIMKITPTCNLRCPYCYTKHTISEEKKIMSMDIAEKIIQNAASDYDFVDFTLHGGEPLMVGAEWIKEFVALVKKYKKMYKFDYKIGAQSNITLMNEEINDFFVKEKIKVGFSYDGLTNYKTRKNTEIVIKNKVKYSSIGGCICMLTKENIHNIENEIDHFDEVNFGVRFNFVFDTTSGVERNLNEITKEETLECYIKMFNHIIKKKESTAQAMFDKFFYKIYGGSCNLLCSSGNCFGTWIGVHYDGTIYPCGQEWDKFEKYTYGNISDIKIKDVFLTKKALDFKSKLDGKIKICKETCEVHDICNGGCPGENKANGKDIDSFIENHCYLMKNFYKYLLDFVNSEKVESVKNTYILNKIISTKECK
ncbi:MAG: radical SAM protein [Paraclostridium sp.]